MLVRLLHNAAIFDGAVMDARAAYDGVGSALDGKRTDEPTALP